MKENTKCPFQPFSVIFLTKPGESTCVAHKSLNAFLRTAHLCNEFKGENWCATEEACLF